MDGALVVVLLKGIFTLALLAVAGWGGHWLWQPENLPVNTVRIESQLKRVDQHAVREAVLPYVEAGILRLDVDGIRTGLESIPWVAHASVRRSWPDRVIVQIEEHQAAARWGESMLLSREGVVFQPASVEPFSSLPAFSGPEKSEQLVMKRYQEMEKLLEPVGMHIEQLRLDERRAWQLSLHNGLKLLIGRDDVYARLLRFARFYPQALQPRLADIEQVDLRYTNGFAVRWRNGAPEAQV